MFWKKSAKLQRIPKHHLLSSTCRLQRGGAGDSGPAPGQEEAFSGKQAPTPKKKANRAATEPGGGGAGGGGGGRGV